MRAAIQRLLAVILVLACTMAGLPLSAYAETALTAEEITLLTAAPETTETPEAAEPAPASEMIPAAEPLSVQETPAEELPAEQESVVEPDIGAVPEPEVAEELLAEAEAVAEPTPVPESSPEPMLPVETEPVQDVAAEFTPEPTAEPSTQPNAEPTVEPTAQPNEAPTAEPTAQPNEAPTAEPTAQPAAPPAAILIPESLTLQVGQAYQLRPELQPADLTAKFSYSISDGNILSVNATGGILLAHKEGLAVVRVSISDTVFADCLVLVLPAGEITEIYYENVQYEEPGTLAVGETHQLVYTFEPADANMPIYYSSRDTSVARVDENGLITAVGPGSTAIEATFQSFSGLMAGSLRISLVPVRVSTVEEKYEHFFEIENGVLLSYKGVGGEVVVPDGVTEIASFAFHGEFTTPITSITLPGSVRKLHERAFGYGDYLRSIHLPEGLEVIGPNVFHGFSALEEIDIPDSVTTIGDYAFYRLKQEIHIDLPASLKSVGERAFAESPLVSFSDLPAGLTELGDAAFYNTALSTATIPAGLRSISDSAFNATKLRNITIPSTVEIIGNSAFYYCMDLEEVVIQEGVQRIGEHAFTHCEGLKRVSLPASLTKLGQFALEFYAPDCIVHVPAGSHAWQICVLYGHRCEVSGTLTEEDVYKVSDGDFYGYYGSGGEIVIPEGVTSISPDLFISNRSEVTGLRLPSTLKTIGDRAFYECTALKTVSFGSSLEKIGAYAFFNTAIESIELPGSVRTIGNGAFAGCTALRSATISEGIESLPYYIFDNCPLLDQLILPASVKKIPNNAFSYNKLPFVLAPAGSYALDYCRQYNIPCGIIGAYEDAAFIIENGVLKKYIGTAEHVTIPEGVTGIADQAFQGNTTMVSLSFPSTLTSIGRRAFQGCTALTEAVLPNSVRSLGLYAFQDCTALKRAVLPDDLSSLSAGTFTNCSSLSEIHLSQALVSIGNYCFSHCSSLKAIELPESLSRIEANAFDSCTALESIDLPDKVNRITYEAFFNCTSLKHVRFPKALTQLDDRCFAGCTSLSSINLPSGVKILYTCCFYGCTSLKDAYVPSSASTFGTGIFSDCPELTVRGSKNSKIHRYCTDNAIPFNSSNVNPNILAFPEGDLVLGVGQSYVLKADVDGAAAMGAVSFKSSSSSRVAVDSATGEITAKKTGTATITATVPSGLTASCKITVKAAPKSVILKEKEVTLSVGESVQLGAEMPKNTAASLRYDATSSVVSVTEDGLVTAISPGSETVTVTTHNGMSDSCTVIVLPAPTAITLDRSSITLRESTSDLLAPSVNPESRCSSYSFESSDPAIVSVDEAGRITGLSRGTAMVTASTHNGLSAACSVTVIAPPPRLELPAAIELGIKESCVLTPAYVFEEGSYTGSYSFTSKSSKVVSVDAAGTVTGLRTGSTVITVTSEDGISATCTVTVKRAPSKIELDATAYELGVGEQRALKWTLTKSSASAVRFTSSDPAVAQVSEDGVITALTSGSATIIAATFNGKSDKCTVTVYAAPTILDFDGPDPEYIKLGIGMKGSLQPRFGAGEGGSVTYSVSDPSVFSLDPVTGEYEVLKEIRSTTPVIISITSYNGLTASRQLLTYRAPEFMKFAEEKITLGIGDSYETGLDYFYTLYYTPGVSYKSSKTSVATVDANGVITAKKAGSATITVTSYNGLSAKCTVTVKKAPSSIALPYGELTLGYDEYVTLTPVFSPKNSFASVRFSSSNPKALYVNETTGDIQAKQSFGIVTVTATTSNGLSASCRVSLNRAPQSIYFPQSSITVPVGMEIPLDVRISDGACSTIYFAADPTYVKFGSDGSLTAKKKGVTRIEVETYNSRRASLTVNIVAAPSKYKLALPTSMQVGEVYNIYDYLSSTPALDPALLIKSVTVNNSKAELIESPLGVFLMPVEAGSFTVTVKTYNNKSLRVNVKATAHSGTVNPNYSAPADAAATLESYLGKWTLRGVSAADGKLSYPPEMFGFSSWTIDVRQNSAAISIDGEGETTAIEMEGSSLLLRSLLLDLECIRHTNGWMSIPLYEDVFLWFSK